LHSSARGALAEYLNALSGSASAGAGEGEHGGGEHGGGISIARVMSGISVPLHPALL
jgi:hypothetical protein